LQRVLLSNASTPQADFSQRLRVARASGHTKSRNVEQVDSVRALVLELVEGEALADRLTHGALSLGDALSVARQIAEALEAALEKGIVHRDLKPANIKATPTATLKVLDFGAGQSPRKRRGECFAIADGRHRRDS
jgi:serine/threonine protein kinase